MTKQRAFVIAISLLTLGILIWVINIVDKMPRTDNAYVYADTINVAPEVSGNIIELPIKENQLVKKGDVLLKIDPRSYLDALARSKASLAQLEQQIILTQRDVNAQVFNAEAAKKRIIAAEATAERDASTLRRYQALQKQNYVSKEMLDHALAAQRSSASQLQTTRFEAKQAEAAISSVAALEAQRDVIKADISIAELDLEHTTIVAPFDGRVTSLKTTLGQYASVGKAIFTLLDSNRWYVIANFRESDLKNIHPNSKVDIYLMSNTKRIYQGVVDSIGYGVYSDDGGKIQEGLPSIERSINWVRVAQRFPVRIRVLNPDPTQFRMGTSAVATILDKDYTAPDNANIKIDPYAG